MQVTIIYAIAYASTLGFLFLWRISHFLTAQARKHLFSTFSKWFLYTILLPRLRGSSDLTVFASCITGPIYRCEHHRLSGSVHSKAEFSLCLVKLTTTNLMCLYFGGRTNILLDRLFHLSHTDQINLHRWIGRIAVIEGLIHGTVGISELQSPTRWKHISVRYTEYSPGKDVSDSE